MSLITVRLGLKLKVLLLLPQIAVIINSDYDDDHDAPKGEVSQNVLVNCNDISDISKDTFDDK